MKKAIFGLVSLVLSGGTELVWLAFFIMYKTASFSEDKTAAALLLVLSTSIGIVVCILALASSIAQTLLGKGKFRWLGVVAGLFSVGCIVHFGLFMHSKIFSGPP